MHCCVGGRVGGGGGRGVAFTRGVETCDLFLGRVALHLSIAG